MIDSKFYLVGIFLVLLCAAGFAGLHTPISTPDNSEQDELVVSHMVLLLDKDASIFSVDMKPKVCIRSGNPSRAEERDFGRCIAGSGCTNWEQHTDDESGDTAMICQDEGQGGLE